MGTNRNPLFLYALGHFAVDFCCAWLLLGRLTGDAQWPLLCLTYNFCAFALQMPLGIVADRMGRNRLCSALGAAMVLLAFCPWGAWYTALLAGLGNALYHIGGGRETLLADDRYRGVGIFVAPGAVGLFLGGLLTKSNLAGLTGGMLLGLCGLALSLLHRREIPSPRDMEKPRRGAAGLLSLLFLIVLLRSLVGLTMENPWKTGLWIAAGALLGAAGKALGGLSADRWGAKLAGGVSLLLGAALFLLPQSPVAGVLGGLLFQMSMPITLRDSARVLPGGEGFTFGLLTFALFLGFLPCLMGFTMAPRMGAALSALSGTGLLLCCKRRETT